jgi:hypothetical protein
MKVYIAFVYLSKHFILVSRQPFTGIDGGAKGEGAISANTLAFSITRR